MDPGRPATAALLVAALVGLGLSMPGEASRGLHVSGDMAGALPRSDAASPEAARVEVMALWGWTKLPHLAGAAALWGPPSEAVPGPRVVRVIDLAPRGVRKIVLIRLGEGVGVTERARAGGHPLRPRHHPRGDGAAPRRRPALWRGCRHPLAPPAGPGLRDSLASPHSGMLPVSPST